MNPEHVGDVYTDRKAIFDVYCEGENGEKFIVEMQNAYQAYFKDRSLFYSTFPIREQAPKGSDWDFKLSKPGIQFQHLCISPIRSVKNQFYKKYGKYCFQKITGKCNNAGFPSKHPQRICRACISASLLTDINSLTFSIQISGLKQTESISDQ